MLGSKSLGRVVFFSLGYLAGTRAGRYQDLSAADLADQLEHWLRPADAQGQGVPLRP